MLNGLPIKKHASSWSASQFSGEVSVLKASEKVLNLVVAQVYAAAKVTCIQPFLGF